MAAITAQELELQMPDASNLLSDEPDETLELAGVRLEVNKYRPIAPNDQGWLWSESLEFF